MEELFVKRWTTSLPTETFTYYYYTTDKHVGGISFDVINLGFKNERAIYLLGYNTSKEKLKKSYNMEEDSLPDFKKDLIGDIFIESIDITKSESEEE